MLSGTTIEKQVGVSVRSAAKPQLYKKLKP